MASKIARAGGVQDHRSLVCARAQQNDVGSGAELGHVTLTPPEIMPVRGLSPIEALRRTLDRVDHATDAGRTKD